MEKGFVNKIVFCLLLYGLVTVICGVSCFFLPEFKPVIFCVWYILTLVFWAITAVTLIVFCCKLIKLAKKSNKFNGKDDNL